MMKSQKVASVVMAVALAIPAISMAQNYYAGVDAGSSKTSGSSNTSTVGLFGGYNFNSMFGAEVGYNRLGNKNGVTSSAVSLTGLGYYWFNPQTALFGRLGIARWKESGNGVSVNKTDPLLGVGFSYKINDQFSARAEADWMRSSTYGTTRSLLVSGIYNF